MAEQKTFTESDIAAAVERISGMARGRARQAQDDADAKQGIDKIPFLMAAHGWKARADGAVSIMKELGIHD